MVPLKSAVWRYFTKTETSKATCKLCCKTLKTGEGTSNLKQHLIHKHPKIYIEDGTNREKAGHVNGTESCAVSSKSPTTSLSNSSRCSSPSTLTATSSRTSRSRSPSTSRMGRSRSPSPLTSPTHSQNSSLAPQRRQPTLYETTQRSASYERGGHRDILISNSLIYMVCKDNAPHSIVEKEGFRQFTKTLAPLYKLPSRNTVTEMVSLRYSAIISKMKSKLLTVKHMSLTADICTLTNTSRGFLVVTAHFICPEKNEVVTIMLGVCRLLETHTGDYIAQKMEELMDSFSISKSKIVSVCTDGGANMIAGVRKLLGEGKNVYCLAHMLNLIVMDGLEDKNNKPLKELIDLVKSFVTFARHSNNFMDALRAEQRRDGVPEGGVALFIQSVPTRWNSTFDMLSRFVILYPYVARVLANPKIKNAPRMLSGNEIELLSEIEQILKPFKQATTEISGSDYLTGSLVLPMINCIHSALGAIKPTNEISTILLRKLQESLESRCGSLEINPLLCNALLCDPRFKKLYMKPIVASQAVRQISEEIKKVQKELGKYSPPKSASSSQQGQEDLDGFLWSSHDKSLEKAGMFSLEVESSFPSELKLYLHQPVLSRIQDPIQFWQQSKAFMAALSSVAIKYLTVVGSSVASERLVSSLNSVVADDRSRLTDAHITERVFMNRVSKSYWVD